MPCPPPLAVRTIVPDLRPLSMQFLVFECRYQYTQRESAVHRAAHWYHAHEPPLGASFFFMMLRREPRK